MAKPLCYKVSWNFDMVLVSQNRDSVMIEDGKHVAVPAGRQHDNHFIHEIEVADALRSGQLRKTVAALIAGQFQERYPAGASFGHFAAVIEGENDSASAKRRILATAGARVASSLQEIPQLLASHR